MPGELDRMLAMDRALDDVRFAKRLLLDHGAPASWRGPARDAFAQAYSAIPLLLSSAEAALERERIRAVLALQTERERGPDDRFR